MYKNIINSFKWTQILLSCWEQVIFVRTSELTRNRQDQDVVVKSTHNLYRSIWPITIRNIQ